MPDPNRWVPARLAGDHRETESARTLLLDAPDLGPALAGQHVDVRLTAEDGYTAERSYSLSSAAAARPVEMTVERFDDGEVSPYLVDGLAVGDSIELRGPIGGWLVWRSEQEGPVQLVAGGSGVAPLMSMVRTRQAVRSDAPFRLLYSVTDPDRVYYRSELDALPPLGVAVDLWFTRRSPDGAPPPRRLTEEDVDRLTLPPEDEPTVYVCGPTGFVEAVAGALVARGHPERRIRTERFGPTG